MKGPIRAALAAALLGSASTLMACSCIPPVPLEVEWRGTPAIVEAEFVSATITLQRGEPIEDGVLRVITRFKGAFKVGDLIRTRSNISGSACGLSLRGTPPAAIEEAQERSSLPYWRWGAYDRWMLFLSGARPFEVSTCSRSQPSVLFTERTELLQLRSTRAVAPSRPEK